MFHSSRTQPSCWRRLLAAIGLAAVSAGAFAVPKDLALPSGQPTPEQVADQVYYANHFYSFDNFSIDRRARKMAILINKDPGGGYNRSGVERHLNNSYPPGDAIKSRDLAIFHSGLMRGTGILVTEFSDEDRSQSYDIWLPSLRKVRRFAEPDHGEMWGGSVFTFGDVTLRKPDHEIHEILGKKRFRTCLGVMEDIEDQHYMHVEQTPKRTCRHADKEVYGLKSTTKYDDWWYDYRISFVDAENFADYRTVYYKDGQMIKVIDRDWGLVKRSGKNDPRALFWKYWYGLDLRDGRESWAIVPQGVIEFDTNRDEGFWSDRTLRRIRR